MIALQKRDGGVRGIATGTSFPQTRRESVGSSVQRTSGTGLLCPREQGRIAWVMQFELPCCDVVQGGRGAVPSRAVNFRQSRACTPQFVRLGRRRRCATHHRATRGRGTRRPHMPLLFSLGIQQQLEPSESLFAFLDDVHICCTNCSKQRCENELASSCTWARHARGIAQESVQLTWRISDQMVGTP